MLQLDFDEEDQATGYCNIGVQLVKRIISSPLLSLILIEPSDGGLLYRI